MKALGQHISYIVLLLLVAACGSAPAATTNSTITPATTSAAAAPTTAATTAVAATIGETTTSATNPATTPATAATAASATSGTYPVSIENCGKTLTFQKPPERVLVTYQNIAETLIKLGLKDKIVGVAYGQAYNPPPDMAADVNGLNYLSPRGKGSASKEVALNTRPDFVISAYPTFDFDAAQGMATQEDFLAVGAPMYGTTAECQNSVPNGSIESVYSDILNFGRIFGIEVRAQAVVQEMRDRIAAVQAKVASLPPVSVAFYDAGEDQLGFYGSGLNSDMIKLAGGTNVFADQPEAYLQVSKEAFAVKNPDIFAVLDYEDQPSVPDEPARAEFLFKTFPNMTASQQKRWVAVSGAAFAAGIRIPDAVEGMAKAFHPDAFADQPAINTAAYPVTIQNCGYSVTYSKPPERVVTTYQPATDILLALGLADRIVLAGGNYDVQPIAPLQDAFATLGDRVRKEIPQREELLTAKPDFVFSTDPSYDFSAKNGNATREDLASAKVNIYAFEHRCETATGSFTSGQISDGYTDIRNIGRIFGITERAEAYIAQEQARIAAVAERVAGKTPTNAIIYGSGEGPLNVYADGLFAELVERAGGVNLFKGLGEDYGPVSAEVFLTKQPDIYIVVGNDADASAKAKFLFTTFPDHPASQAGRYLAVGDTQFYAGASAAFTVEQFARSFHPEAFK